MVVERMVSNQEIGSSNPLALVTLSSRSHIDLHRNCFALFSHKTCPDLSINVCFCLVGVRNQAYASQNRSRTGNPEESWAK
jgi:hypothetical protein